VFVVGRKNTPHASGQKARNCDRSHDYDQSLILNLVYGNDRSASGAESNQNFD